MEEWWEYRNGCISIQILQEFYVTLTRKISLPVEGSIARQLVAGLAQWRLHSPQVDDLVEAIDLQQTHQLSFWDAMALQSAIRMGCGKFVSEDLGHHQKYGELEVINPFVE
jgi:predicted nucleic acid-binding protein